MSRNRSPASHSFPPAPAAGRVRMVTLLCFGITAVVTTIIAIFATVTKSEHAAPMILGVVAGLPLVFVIWFCARIRAYEIDGDVLRVVRRLYTATIPLAELESVHADRAALEGARKVIGNDGLGAIAGRFRSAKLGTFRVFVTDPERAVILRWPDRCVILSPEKPGLFVDAVRTMTRRESRST